MSVPLSGSNYFFLTKKLFIHKLEKFQNIKKGQISDLVLDNLFNNENNGDSKDYENDDYQISYSKNSKDNKDSKDFENYDDNDEVNFASTEFNSDKSELSKINFKYNFNWIKL